METRSYPISYVKAHIEISFILQMLNGKIYETKASLLRKFEPSVQQNSFWHMPKWDKV